MMHYVDARTVLALSTNHKRDGLALRGLGDRFVPSVADVEQKRLCLFPIAFE